MFATSLVQGLVDVAWYVRARVECCKRVPCAWCVIRGHVKFPSEKTSTICRYHKRECRATFAVHRVTGNGSGGRWHKLAYLHTLRSRSKRMERAA